MEQEARTARHHTLQDWCEELVGPQERAMLQDALLSMLGDLGLDGLQEGLGAGHVDERADAEHGSGGSPPEAAEETGAAGGVSAAGVDGSRASGGMDGVAHRRSGRGSDEGGGASPAIDAHQLTPLTFGVDSLVKEHMDLAEDDEERTLLSRDLPPLPSAGAAGNGGAARAAQGRGASVRTSQQQSSGGAIADSMRLLEGNWPEWWDPVECPRELQSAWYQFPPDDVLWEKTLSPQLRDAHVTILDRLGRLMRGERLAEWERQDILERALEHAAEEEAAGAGGSTSEAAGPRLGGASGGASSGPAAGTLSGRPPAAKRPRRRYYPSAAWAMMPPAAEGTRLWAPPPPEFLHLMASGEMAAAADVVPVVQSRLVAAGVDPATAAAAADGRFGALPPLTPPGSMQAAPAAGPPDPYGYPITSYNATEILHRAAVETARMEGRAPPPPPNRYTYMAAGGTGRRVGPGLTALRLAVPPPWLACFREMHKVLRYWSEEQEADITRLRDRNPALDMPDCLSREALLACGALSPDRDLPSSDSESDDDDDVMQGGSAAAAPPKAMEWRAAGPGRVAARRTVRASEPAQPPDREQPILSWQEAVRRAAIGLGRPVPQSLPPPPSLAEAGGGGLAPSPAGAEAGGGGQAAPAAGAEAGGGGPAAAEAPVSAPSQAHPAAYGVPLPYFSDEQLAWEAEYDARQQALPRVRVVRPEEADLTEQAARIMRLSRPGAAIQL